MDETARCAKLITVLCFHEYCFVFPLQKQQLDSRGISIDQSDSPNVNFLLAEIRRIEKQSMIGNYG